MKLPSLKALLAQASWHTLTGALLGAGLGIVLFLSPWTGGLKRISYDLPFALRKNPIPPEAVIVAMDEDSFRALDQQYGTLWDRGLHAQLINRLTGEGARVIAFDIIFSDPDLDHPETDKALADAIKAHGKVVLGGEVQMVEDSRGIVSEHLYPPAEQFATNAAAWADVQQPVDVDGAIRRHLPTATPPHSLAWATAKLASATAAQQDEEANRVRWINYYGPPGTIPTVSYHQALLTNGVPAGFFKDKVVFVGQHLATGMGGDIKDSFGTAHTWLGKGFSAGTEIHATISLNLLRNDWLKTMPRGVELLLLSLIGALAGAGVTLLKPWPAVAGGCLVALLGFALGCILFRFQSHWFAWAIVILQVIAVLAWHLVWTAWKLSVEKQVLRESLDVHLSPARVEQLLKDPDLLKPGGAQQQVSILFSDIANFSKHSERLEPNDLFQLLNNYYGEALKSFHETDGTIVQIIGDAIYAIWNAPIEQGDHQQRAVRTALDLHQKLVRFNEGKNPLPIRTRVGIHTGEATVGNLGSNKRFDFACIGTNVNLTSRLEGLNKHLGTDLLATRAIQRHVEDTVVSRRLGFFKFKGFGRAFEIHELLGEGERVAAKTKAWRDSFEDALQHYQRRRFSAAEQAFRDTIRLRQEAERDKVHEDHADQEDGPSAFYLARIPALKAKEPPDGWDGEIDMQEK